LQFLRLDGSGRLQVASEMTENNNNYHSKFIKSYSLKEGYNNLLVKLGYRGCLLFSSEKK
jgi:hypothetical protein